MALDRILQTASSPSNGDVTLAGVEAGYRAFSPAYTAGAGDDIDYYIEQYDLTTGALTGKWEVGVGKLTTATTLQRTTPTVSSAGVATAETFNGPVRVGNSPTDLAIRRIISSLRNIANGILGVEADQSVTLPVVAAPTTPASRLKLFAKNIANRLMLATVGPAGLDVVLQPSMKRNKVGIITASGDGTVVTTMGMSAITVVATTARSTTTSSLLQSMRRLGFVTTASAGTVCSWRQFAAPYYVGVAPNIGGFDASVRFGVSDASLVAGSQMFIGLIQSPGTAPVSGDASTRAFAMIGVGKDAADTNFQIMHKATAVATPATKVDTGIAVATDTAYEISLFATPNIPGQVGWRFENLSTGAFATGTITTDLPVGTLGLGFQGYRSNGATAAAAAMDLSTIYVETDF